MMTDAAGPRYRAHEEVTCEPYIGRKCGRASTADGVGRGQNRLRHYRQAQSRSCTTHVEVCLRDWAFSVGSMGDLKMSESQKATWCTIQEAADMLMVSRATVKKLAAQRRVSSFRLVGTRQRTKISRADVRDLVRQSVSVAVA